MTRSAQKVSDLARQLNLLPYFQKHQGRSVIEAARDLGQPPQEIMADLNRLWLCGLPGLLPGDMVELEHSLKEVKIYNAQGMDKPLRLTPTEAGVLLLILESLESLPGLSNQEAAISAATKLRSIMGDYSSAVFDSTGDSDAAGVLSVLRDAMDQKRQVAFTYHSYSSDNTSQRVVSAAHIFTNEGETYVTAWEDAVNDHRTFRLDRISNIGLTQVASKPHSMRLKFSADDPFDIAKQSDVATFLLCEDAIWLADYMAMTIDEQTPAQVDSDGKKWFKVSYPLLSREWFIRFVISHAESIKSIEPADLQESINQKVAHGLSAYNVDVQ
ncbi:helix-turn-helix transcriptional regulator [Corynebacterium callunae]|uniref:helix-turn-helix transcriptional regulator n=1 Tax=Corynebacterium callunae TaxID=1721 RepID=UPI001FFFE956|nr:WYL domain-containing protein [Corynebacterium callunae]MCK2200118.1 WYL domain-containing protein [Corynebacterium callunae]